MGVLSLHNECPPLGYGPDTQEICDGLVLGEEGTSSMLRALSDCLNALAAMDDTVAHLVKAFIPPTDTSFPTAPGNGNGDKGPQQSYDMVYQALEHTVERIDLALSKYHDWAAYANKATEAGRGKTFQAALEAAAGSDFQTLVQSRIELLRKLKVRVLILEQFKERGYEMFRNFDYPGFFLLFMAPVRDMALSVNDLYGEVVLGAGAS